MKRLSVLALLLLIVSCSSSSVKKEKPVSGESEGVNVFADETPGQYVIYHNKRGDQDALYCFMKFNKTDYVARRYDLKNGEEIVIQFEALKKGDGDYDIRVVQVFAGDDPGVMRMLTDMLNMITQYGVYAGKGTDNTTISDEWKEFGYTLNHTYKAWIPFFHLYKTEMKNEPGNSMTLILVGVMKGEKEYSSFNLKGIPKAGMFKPFTIKKSGGNSSFRFGMYEIPIDGNWEKSGYGNQHVKSYWIRKSSMRDAALTLEVVPKSMLGGDLDKIAYRGICFSTWVVPSSVKIEKKKNFVKVTYLVLDPGSMNETYMYDIYMKDSAGDLNAFHFSSYKEVYHANRKYFDSIINKLKITGK